MFKLLKILVVSAFMLTPFAAFAKNGDDPIEYIVITMTDVLTTSKEVGFKGDELKELNGASYEQANKIIRSLAQKALIRYDYDYDAFEIGPILSEKQYEMLKAGKDFEVIGTHNYKDEESKLTVTLKFEFK